MNHLISKKYKNREMIIHKAVIPNTDNPEPVNFCWVAINDHDHVLNPNMDQNTVANAATMLLQYMELAPNDANTTFNQGEPIGMKAKEDNLEEIKERLTREGYTADTEYEISTILALTITLNFSVHAPAINVCEMEFNLICSVSRRQEQRYQHADYEENFNINFGDFQ